MAGYEKIRARQTELSEKVQRLLNPDLDEQFNPCPIPTESDPTVAQYITDLYLDGLEFKRKYFKATEHMRPKLPSGLSFGFEDWRKHCESLAKGRNFDVWGRRAEDWMQERVDGEIPRNMHVRRDHITSNWHEIELNPNVKGIADIFDQERKKMGWKDWIEMLVGTTQTYGYVVNEIVIDYTLHPDGQIKNVVRMPDQIMRTPESASFEKSDGCTYVVVLDSVNDKQIREQFPDLDFTTLKTVTDIQNEIHSNRKNNESTYKHTRFYPKLRAFLDDNSIEQIPFDEQAQAEMTDELSRMLDGELIQAQPTQHHIEHIKAKLGAVDNLLSVQPESEDDEIMGEAIAAAHLDNVEQHVDHILNAETDLEAQGLRRKYPHGRYICQIGGQVVHDMPNPYEVPWRVLFRELQNQRVVNRIDGEGDPEIMFTEAYQADMQLSRIEDLSILQMPQVYRPIADKTISGEDVNDNNPRRIRYTTGQVYTVQGEAPTAQLELYKIAKENSQRDRGVNDISYGNQPPAGTPARLISLVQSQNQTIITGELDRNLREFLEDVVEGMFEVMKVIYNQNRQYIINGQYVEVNVAELLKVYEVKDPATGVVVKKPLPKIEVTVKPGSNYPNQWERRLAFLVEMSQTKDETGLPLVPSAAIYDQMAIQYPEFAEGGKYRHMNEATAIGMQILAQEQAIREQKAKEGNSIAKASNKFDKENLTPQLAGATNGKEH